MNPKYGKQSEYSMELDNAYARIISKCGQEPFNYLTPINTWSPLAEDLYNRLVKSGYVVSLVLEDKGYLINKPVSSMLASKGSYLLHVSAPGKNMTEYLSNQYQGRLKEVITNDAIMRDLEDTRKILFDKVNKLSEDRDNLVQQNFELARKKREIVGFWARLVYLFTGK